MSATLILRHSIGYSKSGVSLPGALLKHSLVPTALLRRILPARGLLLDLGCGEGMLANLMADRLPGLQVHGLDRDPDRVALANRNRAPNARFDAGEILDATFEAAAAAIVNDVLHHHPPAAQEALLRKIAGFLGDAGVLVVKEVDALDWSDRRWTSFWDSRLYRGETLHFRTAGGWKALLGEHGFDVLDTVRVGHPWPASRTVLVCRKRSAAPRAPGVSPDAPAGRAQVLVTGATGFLGQHLAAHLCEHGLGGSPVAVTIVARQASRVPAALADQCRVIVGDLAAPSVASVAREMDYVFHLAAEKSFFGGAQVFANNLAGTVAVLRALEGSAVLKRLVFASSMGAVDRPADDPCATPMSEESPARPSSHYGKAKLESERLIQQSGLPFTILRLPWCYGPGMSAGTHIRTLTAMVMRGSLISRFAWPGRVSVLDAHECARAFAAVADRAETLGQVFFVADPAPLRFGELFREAGETVGRPAGSIPIPAIVVRTAYRLRRFLPFAVRCLFMDVLLVSDERLRRLSFSAASRGKHYLLPLARFVSDVKAPGRRHSRVVVTGAASGIGYALSVQLAASGRQVVMVDRDANVEKLAEQLGVEACVADLSVPEDLERVASRLQAADVDWLVNAAGLGVRGDTRDIPDDRTSLVLGVNVDALTRLSVAAVRSFSAAGEGVVVNIASSAGLQPLPGMAVYAATKAYALSFSEALGAEQADGRVAVITVCPSGVATGFQAAAGVRRDPKERLLSPERVASDILRAAERRETTTLFIGARTMQMALLARVLPRRVVVRLWKALMTSNR